MKKERKNIMMTIGIILKMKNSQNKRMSRHPLPYFILMLLIALSTKSQTSECGYHVEYDSITAKKVYVTADEMPFHPKDEISIKEYIAVRYGISSEIGLFISFRVGFIINCEGKLIGARIYNKGKEKCITKYTEEEKKVVDILNTYPIKWSPGICSGKKVNVLLRTNLSFAVDENGRLR